MSLPFVCVSLCPPIGGNIQLLVIDGGDTISFRKPRGNAWLGSPKLLSKGSRFKLQNPSQTALFRTHEGVPLVSLSLDAAQRRTYTLWLIRNRRDTMSIRLRNFPEDNFFLEIPFQTGRYTLTLLEAYTPEQIQTFDKSSRFFRKKAFTNSPFAIGYDISPKDWMPFLATDSFPLLPYPCDLQKVAGKFHLPLAFPDWPIDSYLILSGESMIQLRTSPPIDTAPTGGMFYQEIHHTLIQTRECHILRVHQDSVLTLNRSSADAWYWEEPPGLYDEEPVPTSQLDSLPPPDPQLFEWKWKRGAGGMFFCTPNTAYFMDSVGRPFMTPNEAFIWEVLPEAWPLDTICTQYNAEWLPKKYHHRVSLNRVNPLTDQAVHIWLSPFTYGNVRWDYQPLDRGYVVLSEEGALWSPAQGCGVWEFGF